MNRNDKQRQEWIKKTIRALPKGRILDAGAGELRNKAYCSHLEYVSQDLCQYDGRGDDKGLQNQAWDTSKIDIISDITAIPVDDETFEYILCTEVFEHIKDPIGALREFSRVLKPGGTLIVTAPFCSLTHMAPEHIYSGFNRYFYLSIMPEYGYENIRCEPNGDYYQYMEQELKRIGFISKKYGFGGVSFILKLLILPAIALYRLLSLTSSDTSDLLCFGYNVVATKTQKK